MFKVSGKVLVKETGVGIPNLLIVLYDVDPRAASQSTAYMDTSCLTEAGLKRIGSVLSAENGDFEISFEAAAFAAGDPEARPDLTLRVFAPEDSQSSDQLKSLPPRERLLLNSYIMRQNVGQSEAYILRITQAQLDHFGIPYPKSSTTGKLDTDSILSALDASFARDDAIREKLNQRHAKRLEKAREAARRAQRAFASFYPSSMPKDLRADPAYFAPGDDLKVSQELIMKRDIERAYAKGKRQRLRMSLTEDELSRIGFTTAPNGARTVNLKWLFKLIEDKNQGAQFTWTRSSLPPCKEGKKANTIIAYITNTNHHPGEPPTEPEPHDPDEALAELTAETLVREMVARHMEHVTPAEAQLEYGVSERPELDGIATAINAFEVKGGPADVTAYHDFHNLQIAFEHIWTEQIDKLLAGWGSVIYRLWIGQKQDHGLDDEPDPQVETLDDLCALLPAIAAEQEMSEAVEEVPFIVRETWESLITDEEWTHLSPSDRLTIIYWAENRPTGYMESRNVDAAIRDLIDNNERQIAESRKKQHTQEAAEVARRKSAKLLKLLDDLKALLAEPYKFDIFAPDSINYGILVTYRQEWRPLSYQVGELVSTIPLAPKETRRYTKRRVVKKSRSQKEIEDSLRIIRRDSADTRRADAEIVERAVNKTNFKAAAEGSGKIGIVELSGSTELAVDAEKTSAQTKKDFREAVVKAAEEYKQERRLEVESVEAEELEETTSGEITNPNDELTVTYLLYELQRRYEIIEKIHRLTPVILVANQMPAPHEIDEDWLIAHDWILKRVILDDSFVPALDYLKSLTGAAFALEVMRANVEKQAEIVNDLREQIKLKKKMMAKTLQDLQKALERQARVTEREESEGIFESVGEALFGEGPGESTEAERIRAERAKMAVDQVERELQQLESQFSSEETSLEAATKEYTAALKEHLDRRTDISRLRVHVKQNILYYMQAIWEHEPPDQRYFRLYNKKAAWLPVPEDMQVMVGEGGKIDYEFALWPLLQSFEWKTLVEIADLDNLIGFKGNYMIFPLKQNNFVTWYMMQPYLDDILGLRDPDDFANYTTEELIENFRCRYSQDPDAFTDEEIGEWRERILERLTAPRREKDIVIVPTDSLYIEALPGEHPLLEDFKLIHRALDVKKVQAEVRHAELENVRAAARLLSGEREDPDIEKRIVFEGDSQGVIVPPDA